MKCQAVHGALLVAALAALGCTSPHPATPVAAAAMPPCFSLYPLAAGARWTYDVDLASGDGGDGDASTRQHLSVVRVVADAAPAGADWRFRVETAPLPADSAVAAVERFRLGGGSLYDADDTRAEHLLLPPRPEQVAAWGGPRTFFPPGDGRWRVVDLDDAPPYRDCVKVQAQLKYGDVTHIYCAGVGPVASAYRERAPRSHTDAAPGHHRDEVWRLRELAPGTCAR